MKSSDITYLDPQTDNSVTTKSVLHTGALNGTILQIAPGGSTPENESPAPRVFFVAQGQVTIDDSLTSVIVSTDEALQIQPDRRISIRNSGDAPARVFVLDLPPARREPPLVVM